MAKKAKKVLTHEEEQKKKLESEMNILEMELPYIPKPTQLFEIGEEVNYRSLKDAKVREVLLDGKLYIIEFTKVSKEKHSDVVTITPNCLTYAKWINLIKIDAKVNESKFGKKDDLRIHFAQMTIQSLFSKVYGFGVNFEPDYQRGYVWDLEDKIALIDSIFENVEIGKFAFIEYSDKKWKETGMSYEILDGKQRLSTLCEFYEGKFEYKGFKFNELHPLDRNHILSHPVSIAEIRDATEQDILKYFVKLNSNGKVMDKEHLDKVRKMLI